MARLICCAVVVGTERELDTLMEPGSMLYMCMDSSSSNLDLAAVDSRDQLVVGLI